MDWVHGNLAERIGGSDFGNQASGYKFEQIKNAAAKAMRSRPELRLIQLGVGEPDERADEGIAKILSAEALKPENRGYADNGIAEFQQAAADYLSRVFQVDSIDPDSEIAHAIGIKSALSILPACFINTGDITLLPVPGYPILGTHTRYLGGEVYPLPLTEANGYLPELEAIPEEICRKAKLLYLNYPHNPTGTAADEDFLERAVQFAKRHRVIIVHDAAYAGLTYDGAKPLSFLSVPGAKDVGIELHSLSKSHNMAGWRIGFAAGNALAIEAFREAKTQYDSGQFMAIQKAAIYGLAHPEILRSNVEKYSRRLDLLANLFRELGFAASKPKGTFFLYMRAPSGLRGGRRFDSAAAFSRYLIEEKGIVTVPWDDTESSIRVSATFEARTREDELQLIEEIRRRLADLEFEF